MVMVTVTGSVSRDICEKPKHAKNASLGKKKVIYSGKICLDQQDARSFKVGDETTLMNWGNTYIRDFQQNAEGRIATLILDLHLEGDFERTDKKITWLSMDQELVPVAAFGFQLSNYQG